MVHCYVTWLTYFKHLYRQGDIVGLLRKVLLSSRHTANCVSRWQHQQQGHIIIQFDHFVVIETMTDGLCFSDTWRLNTNTGTSYYDMGFAYITYNTTYNHLQHIQLYRRLLLPRIYCTMSRKKCYSTHWANGKLDIDFSPNFRQASEHRLQGNLIGLKSLVMSSYTATSLLLTLNKWYRIGGETITTICQQHQDCLRVQYLHTFIFTF